MSCVIRQGAVLARGVHALPVVARTAVQVMVVNGGARSFASARSVLPVAVGVRFLSLDAPKPLSALQLARAKAAKEKAKESAKEKVRARAAKEKERVKKAKEKEKAKEVREKQKAKEAKLKAAAKEREAKLKAEAKEKVKAAKLKEKESLVVQKAKQKEKKEHEELMKRVYYKKQVPSARVLFLQHYIKSGACEDIPNTKRFAAAGAVWSDLLAEERAPYEAQSEELRRAKEAVLARVPKRPANPWALFLGKNYADSMDPASKSDVGTVSKELLKRWKAMSAEEKSRDYPEPLAADWAAYLEQVKEFEASRIREIEAEDARSA